MGIYRLELAQEVNVKSYELLKLPWLPEIMGTTNATLKFHLTIQREITCLPMKYKNNNLLPFLVY